MIKPVDDFVDRSAGAEHRVRPGRDDTARHQHAAALGVEAVEIEPVHRLRDRDQIDLGVADRQRLGHRALVPDFGVRQRLRELRRAAVDREHALEMRGQRDGGLSVAGRAIDGEPAAGPQ